MIKFQINTAEVLLKLFESMSDEAAIQFKHAAVKELVNKHLDKLNVSGAHNKINEAIEEQITSHFGTIKKDYYDRLQNVILNEKIKQEIEDFFWANIKTEINRLLREYIEDRGGLEEIVNKAVSVRTQQLIKDEVNIRLKQLMEQNK